MIRPATPDDVPALLALTAGTGFFKPLEVDTLGGVLTAAVVLGAVVLVAGVTGVLTAAGVAAGLVVLASSALGEPAPGDDEVQPATSRAAAAAPAARKRTGERMVWSVS